MGALSTLWWRSLLALLCSNGVVSSPVAQVGDNDPSYLGLYPDNILQTTPPAPTATAFGERPLQESEEPPFTALYEYPNEDPYEEAPRPNGLKVEQPNMISA